MSNKFSGVLQLTDLDDFITPSQECIKPLDIKNSVATGARIKIQSETYTARREADQKLQKVQITLNDCLACSGCITSAEGVLINQQNFEEVIKTLEQNKKERELGNGKIVVVSLSIQPILSLSHKYDVPAEQMAKQLATLFKMLGADRVLELSIAEDFCLLETQNEFMERFRSKETDNKSLPMLASSCPGWICYAEKTHGNSILPYISTTKSPQQIMGSLVKYRMGYQPDEVYHITLMPCYDKKLEASRNEFFNSTYNAKDVDCVITTIELEQLLNDQNILLPELTQTELDYPWGKPSDAVLFGHYGSGSGGFAHHILVHACRQILGTEISEINWETGKNPDLKQITIESKTSDVVLRFAIANGFRNIQNIIQKIKRGKNLYDYVEIMACPSGCLNGGAQIKPNDGTPTRDIIIQLERHYMNIPRILPEENIIVKKLYNEWFADPGSDKRLASLHTSYHPVEKSTIALNIKW